jgi:hypothetical protein
MVGGKMVEINKSNEKVSSEVVERRSKSLDDIWQSRFVDASDKKKETKELLNALRELLISALPHSLNKHPYLHK